MGPGDFADAEIDGLPGQDGGDVSIGMVIMPAMQHWTGWDLVLVFLCMGATRTTRPDGKLNDCAFAPH